MLEVPYFIGFICKSYSYITILGHVKICSAVQCFCCKKLICWLQNYTYISKAKYHQNLIKTDVAIDRQTTSVWQSKLNLGIGAPDDTLA